jgi:hypothetical protein
LSLAVGWRSGTKMKLGRLETSPDASSRLADVAARCVAGLAGRGPEPWTPEADLPEDSYLMLPAESAGQHPALSRDLAAHGTLLEALRNAAGLPRLDADELPAADMALYAIVIGNDPSTRTVFLRRVNPRRSLRGGRMFSTYRDVLVPLDDPIFGFDDLIDLVYIDNQLVVLSQTAFMALFRDNEALTKQVPAWVGDLASAVPLTPGSTQVLNAKALRNLRVRTRLEAITRRGHLVSVTAEMLRKAFEEHGLDADSLLDEHGALCVDEDNVDVVLQVLNEDLFVGTLSSTAFRADKKSPV